MQRITKAELESRVNYIAKKLDRPKEYNQIGHLFIDHYNPGGNPYTYKLAEIANENLGEHDWTNYRMTIREFYAYLNGIIDGLERANK